MDEHMKMDAFEYEVSGSRLSMGLVKLLHAAITRIAGRGMGTRHAGDQAPSAFPVVLCPFHRR